MQVTGLTSQQRDPHRVNVMIDGAYRFSLDVSQVVDLGLKVGRDYSEAELLAIEEESVFGKLYARTLEYCLMRPHSSREVRDYLYQKTRSTKYKSRRTGELLERPGVSEALTHRVYDRLVEKGYISDQNFARYWVENRKLQKGISSRKLAAELLGKGVSRDMIELSLHVSGRNEQDELQKVIDKKSRRYPDKQKFMAYLVGQGFSYDDVKAALNRSLTDE